MIRLRIVCKTPPEPETKDGYPKINRLLASLSDVHVVAILPDGTEQEISGVTGVTWSAYRDDPARAVLHVHGVEIDAFGLLADKGDM